MASVIAPKDGDVLEKWNDVGLEKWVDENAVGKICDVMGFPFSIYDILNTSMNLLCHNCSSQMGYTLEGTIINA